MTCLSSLWLNPGLTDSHDYNKPWRRCYRNAAFPSFCKEVMEGGAGVLKVCLKSLSFSVLVCHPPGYLQHSQIGCFPEKLVVEVGKPTIAVLLPFFKCPDIWFDLHIQSLLIIFKDVSPSPLQNTIILGDIPLIISDVIHSLVRHAGSLHYYTVLCKRKATDVCTYLMYMYI